MPNGTAVDARTPRAERTAVAHRLLMCRPRYFDVSTASTRG